MEMPFPCERRHYRRYIVPGRVEFHTGRETATGDLINISQGGMLIRSRAVPRGATEIHVRIQDYPIAVEVSGQLVGSEEGRMAIRFLKEPNGMDTLLQWLDRENYPWTAGYGSDGCERGPSQETPAAPDDQPMNVEERNELLEDLYQLG